jgi:glyoxylase-like metal-dependent hydrolase (beta-lactamase superfamily II)
VAIRVLNCAPMHPWCPRWRLGAPCLLVATSHGPVLVDTGLGLHDFIRLLPMVRFFRWDFGTSRDPGCTAVKQLAGMGLDPVSVQHIVLTYLQFDHASGLPDFPHAKVHVHRREYEAMHRRRSWLALACDRAVFAHGPVWVTSDHAGELWLELDAIRLPFDPEMYLIPLFEHPAGHGGVAIRASGGWLIQCADVLPTNAEFGLTPHWLN